MIDYQREPDFEAERRFNERVAHRQARLRERIRKNPNSATRSELAFAVLAALFVGVPGTLFIIGIGANIWRWIATQPPATGHVALGITALLTGLIAWLAREIVKSKIYPIGEIIFGTSLATLGAIEHRETVAAIVAFVGGVRIIVDGFKRFHEYRSYGLFSWVRDKKRAGPAPIAGIPRAHDGFLDRPPIRF